MTEQTITIPGTFTIKEGETLQLSIGINLTATASVTGGGNWTPAEIATDIWLDASDASTITNASGFASQWVDKKGNGFALTQADAGLRPATGSQSINGLNVLRFAGDNMAGPDVFDGSVTDFAFFTVTREVVRGSNFFPSFNGTNAANGQRFYLHSPFSDGTWYLDRNTISGGRSLIAGATSVGDVTLATARFGNGTPENEISLNGGSFSGTSALVATVPSTGGMYLRATATMDMAEIVAIKGTVDLPTRQLIEGYLAHKWGIADLLPLAHPHKDAAPMA